VVELEVFDGEDSATDTVEIVVEEGPPPMEIDPVTDLLARWKSGKVNLVWTPVEGAVAYRVLRTDDHTLQSGFDVLAEAHESDYAVYVDQAVTDGVTYYYVVVPIGAAGQEGPPSDIVEATPSGRTRR